MITMHELAVKIAAIDEPKILVVGDRIEDRYVYGAIVKQAQESQFCPVLLEQRTEVLAGGAGAVAGMVRGLGSDTYDGYRTEECSRKTRYLVGDLQVLRHDADTTRVDDAELSALLERIDAALPRIDLVLVADYGKGVCTDEVLRVVLGGAAAAGISCIVDPAHGSDWQRYQGCTAIKCNTHEWRNADSRYSDNAQWWTKVSAHLVVTDGARGLTWQCSEVPGCVRRHSARSRAVVDVTGAGDAVLASLGFGLAGGLTWAESCLLANVVAGLKVSRRGAVAVSRDEVLTELEKLANEDEAGTSL